MHRIQAYNTQPDDREKIMWVQFERADVNGNMLVLHQFHYNNYFSSVPSTFTDKGVLRGTLY